MTQPGARSEPQPETEPIVEPEAEIEKQPELPQLLESLLFVSSGPIEVSRLQQLLEVDTQTLEQALTILSEQCQSRGLRLQRLGQSAQLVTAPEAAPYIDKLLGMQDTAKLSGAALETLAIIAYEQPVTRARIEAIRGVNCDRALSTLQARNLVCEVGRLDSVGKPILFGTTFEFLEYFGLEDVSQLPIPVTSEQPNPESNPDAKSEIGANVEAKNEAEQGA